jgi:hypothetical protein
MASSTLIHERHIVISPTLAATIGLEEAVMLQVLHDAAHFNPAAGPWREISKEDLLRLLPFWDERACQRISASLRDKGVISVGSAPLDQSDRLRFSLDVASSAPAHKTTAPATTAKLTGGKTLMAERWRPDAELLRQLALHGISAAFAEAQVEEFVLYWSDRGDPAYSWNAKFRSHVIRRWREHEAAAATPDDLPRRIAADWRPDGDALEILERAGVASQFVEDSIPEFVLYWSERGETARTWNSRFVTHVKRQWTRYSSTVAIEGEPRRLNADWQPSGDVFDILHMANIDATFARTLLPEFILFWTDSGEVHTSWNSKFLQHIKYQWARRASAPQPGESGHGNRQGSGGTGSTRARSLVEDLTDRSWAD